MKDLFREGILALIPSLDGLYADIIRWLLEKDTIHLNEDIYIKENLDRGPREDYPARG